MTRIPSVKSVMTPFPYSVAPDATVREARELMRDHGIRHLPVVEDHALVGIVTDRDIKLMLGPDFDYPDQNEIVVSDIALDDPYVVDLEVPLDTVLAEMASRHVGSALVTRGERLAGVFTATDACRCFAEHLRKSRPGGGDAAA